MRFIRCGGQTLDRLVMFNGIVFGGVQFAIAIMRMAEREEPPTAGRRVAGRGMVGWLGVGWLGAGCLGAGWVCGRTPRASGPVAGSRRP